MVIIATVLWGSAYPSIKAGYEMFTIESSDNGRKLNSKHERSIAFDLYGFSFRSNVDNMDTAVKI